MKRFALLFVLAFIAAATPTAAQTTPGNSFFASAGTASTNFFGILGNSETNTVRNTFDFGFGVRLIENIAAEIAWTRTIGAEVSPTESPSSALFFGGRVIYPTTETVDLYGGLSLGRYREPGSDMNAGNALRYKGGALWEFATRTHLGFEARWDSYGGEHAEFAIGTGITFSF